ncbi:translation initiation factor [Chitinophaga parva]|uniref:Translation initiation factor n=1 Tax=Chitinophaga parva TaxID=2169414 RepID=A0A2T7BMB4_9BACT|nr:translation initiation factor [Chitinophaga parva]PUZ28789.1 translation initiation factor [Chitinophaga parva]
MSKNKRTTNGIVFSTNPDFKPQHEEPEIQDTLPPAQQQLRVKLDNKQRGGKTVTLIDGFIGTPDDLEKLGKALKTKCGTGGSVKDGQILIQGDYKAKVIQWLTGWGYTKTK